MTKRKRFSNDRKIEGGPAVHDGREDVKRSTDFLVRTFEQRGRLFEGQAYSERIT